MNVRFLGSPEIYHMQVTVPEPGLVHLHPPIPDVAKTTEIDTKTHSTK